MPESPKTLTEEHFYQFSIESQDDEYLIIKVKKVLFQQTILKFVLI